MIKFRWNEDMIKPIPFLISPWDWVQATEFMCNPQYLSISKLWCAPVTFWILLTSTACVRDQPCSYNNLYKTLTSQMSKYTIKICQYFQDTAKTLQTHSMDKVKWPAGSAGLSWSLARWAESLHQCFHATASSPATSFLPACFLHVTDQLPKSLLLA